MTDDFIIKNALLIDGNGTKAEKMDIAIVDSKIKCIEKQLTGNCNETVIDANHRFLAPGFIDAHSHSDMSIIAAPEATGKISQGVTTEIIGNCGLSVFPVTEKNYEHLNELYKNYNEKISWHSINEYTEILEKRRPAVNIASFCGHNTLRAAVNGYEKKEIPERRLKEMHRLLATSLKNGALGISTGLIYIPGKFSDKKELLYLLKKTAEFTGKIYTTHLRNEGDTLLESIDEAIQLSLDSKLKRLHISHLKAAGKNNWHKLDDALTIISDGQKNGVLITADRYPYTESLTQLSIILPPPFDEMDDVALEKFLQHPENSGKLEKSLLAFSDERWEMIRLVSTSTETYQAFLGEIIADISRKLNISSAALCVDLLKNDAPGTAAAFKGMDENNMLKILKQPYVCCGTDESAKPENYSFGRSHPRGFGSFPRFYNLLKSQTPLETVISKFTSLPATIFGLKNRGKIAPGYAADLVIFDPERIESDADFSNPHQLAKGIDNVWVNGKISIENGSPCNNRNGIFIRT